MFFQWVFVVRINRIYKSLDKQIIHPTHTVLRRARKQREKEAEAEAEDAAAVFGRVRSSAAAAAAPAKDKEEDDDEEELVILPSGRAVPSLVPHAVCPA